MEFGWEVIKKNKALVEEIGVIRMIISKEQTSRAVVEEKLTKLKSLVSVSNALATKLAESDKSLDEAQAEWRL